MPALPRLQPLVISAPFGNYIRPPGASATLGTFTLERRPGRVWRVLRTVWYSRRIGAWVNRIGLRNPGIAWLEDRARSGRIRLGDAVLSIHGFTDAEWDALVDRAAALGPLAIELNMSCPNVGHVGCPEGLFPRAASCGVPVIVKLPPVNFEGMARRALEAGLRAFHCCNTIPVPAGGVSGKPLKPVSIECIGRVRALAREAGAAEGLTIIGGGGITTPADIDDYAAAGADHAAVGTRLFSPVFLLTHRPLAPLIERARERFGGR